MRFHFYKKLLVYREADLAMFEAFLKEVGPAYGKDHGCTPEEAVAQMKEKIGSSGPGQTGVTVCAIIYALCSATNPT